MQGHIHKRVRTTKAGRTSILWYVVIDIGRDGNGRRRQKWHGGFRTRKQAQAVRAQLISDLHLGRYLQHSPMPLGEWIEQHWLPTTMLRVKPSTYHSYERNLINHVLPRIGHTELRYLTANRLNTLYADLLETGRVDGTGGLSPKTVHYIHGTVHKVLHDAVDAGLLATNPATRAKPPRPGRIDPTELRAWNPDQLRRFLSITRDHRLEAAWRLAAMTGMRRGEVLGIRWQDIDLDARLLTVRRTLISVAYRIRESTPKTRRGRRIDLDPATVQALRDHRRRQDNEKAEWGELYNDADLVFCREDGTPLHPQQLSQEFRQLIAGTDLPRIRLHDLRHSHASIGLQSGVPLRVISDRLGHRNPAFTLTQYAHVLPGMQAEAAARIAALVDG